MIFLTDSLIWSGIFNVILRQPDPCSTLKEMCRISRRYVLIFVPSARNYSFFLHRLHHKKANEAWIMARSISCSPLLLWRCTVSFGYRECEIVWLDCPWWPDIVDFGKLISDFFSFPFMKGLSQTRPS